MTTTEPLHTTTAPRIASEVALVDLGRWRNGDEFDRRAIERQVDTALRQVGFFIVVNHGIADDTIEDLRAACADVFALPPATKARFRQHAGIGSPGWIPIGSEANAYASGQVAPPDLKEAWTVGDMAEGAVTPTSRGTIPVVNVFPDDVPGFEPSVRRYLDAGLELSAELFVLLAAAAGQPADTFTRLCSRPLHNLNLTWYPPLVDGDEVVPPAPGQFRIGPHADFGTITVLHREPSDPPLQVQVPDGEWKDLPHVPDSFIVNVGDQLAYWSAGRWRSNPHRIPAPTGDAARSGRLSLVLFVETDLGAMLQPLGRPELEPLDAVSFLTSKLAAIDTAL